MSDRRLSDRAWFDEHVKLIEVHVPGAPPRDECVHCYGDGTPVYPHDEHETRPAYLARMEADLIREALDLARERDRG